MRTISKLIVSGGLLWAGVTGLIYGWAYAAQPSQPAAPTPSQAPAAAPQPAVAAPRELPPQLVLGQRVERVRQEALQCTTVVIVKDAASYIDAIAHWSTQRRFPVLIDDGTMAAHEDIARFIRGFRPEHVARWTRKDAPAAGFETADLKALISSVARAWGLNAENPDQAALLEHWKQSGHRPPGLVVTQENDQAWTGALALAAGRGQPLVFVSVGMDVNGGLTPDKSDELEKAVEQAAAGTGLSWNALGDTLEAVTLCNNGPGRVDTGKESFALTDRIGRLGKLADAGARWAWCGQVFGNAEQAAYRAMCSLFIGTHTAWLFDGYPNSAPWSQFDATDAAKLLKEVGLGVEIDDTPHQGAREWRLRGARAVTANLILVNSKGNNDFFDLEPGQCRPGDVPVLGVPAAVHFVHSWSAQFPAERSTVAGRWLERGVFAYAGSVHEPYLQAFVPTPKVAGRLLGGAPFGVAVRLDAGPLWKIAVIGDPLYTVGPDPKRVEGIPVEGATDALAGLREMLTAEKFADAIDVLTLSGRDAEAARLVQGLAKDKPALYSPEVARASLFALLRAGDNKGVLNAFQKLDAPHARDLSFKDALWLATYPFMDQPDEDVLITLRANIRADQAGRDATNLATAWLRKHDRASAETMLRQVRAGLTEKAQIDAFDKALSEAPEKWAR